MLNEFNVIHSINESYIDQLGATIPHETFLDNGLCLVLDHNHLLLICNIAQHILMTLKLIYQPVQHLLPTSALLSRDLSKNWNYHNQIELV